MSYYMTPSPDSPETWSTQASSPQGISDWHETSIYTTLPASNVNNVNQHQHTFQYIQQQQQHHNHQQQHQQQQQQQHQLVLTTVNDQVMTTINPINTTTITSVNQDPSVNQTAAVFI